MKRIAFIGLGIMGKAMVSNLLKKGFKVGIYARNRRKVEDVIASGCQFYDSVGACVKEAFAVITIVGGPKDVSELYLGKSGILCSAKKGAYLIDMTSSSPRLAKELFDKGLALGLHVLDVPVTGGDVGAKNGTLSLLAGGNKEDLEAVYDILSAMGSKITYEGPAGAGQHTKLVNQIMCAGSLAGMCEGLAYAKSKGLDLQKVLDAVGAGAAASRSLELYGSRIVSGDMQPGGALSYLVKDLSIAQDELANSALDLAMTKAVYGKYKAMADQGFGGLGVQALYEFLLHNNENDNP